MVEKKIASTTGSREYQESSTDDEEVEDQ